MILPTSLERKKKKKVRRVTFLSQEDKLQTRVENS